MPDIRLVRPRGSYVWLLVGGLIAASLAVLTPELTPPATFSEHVETREAARSLPVPKGLRNLLPTWAELRACRFAFLNGSVIGFIIDQKGLMYNLTLEGSKISRIDP